MAASAAPADGVTPDELRQELKRRSDGMTDRLHAEIYAQQRLIGGRWDDVAPSFIVESAETSVVFKGLNHDRDLLEPFVEALEEIAKSGESASADDADGAPEDV
jgi:hypothetical protein